MSIIAAGTTTTTALSSTGNTDGTLQFQVNGTTPSVTLNTLGAIGVGSSPSYGTSGQVLVSSGSTAAPAWTTNVSSQWVTTGSNIYYNTGNVGIGTSSPAAKLMVIGSGGASLYIDSSAGGNNIYDATNHIFRSNSGGSERMRLDSAGNLGLGVTPSASWAGLTAFQIGARAAIGGSTAYTTFSSNAVATTGGWAANYLTNGYATLYAQQVSNGQHQWYTAASGTAGNAITFTQAMTLDASGNLGLGTTSISYRLEVSGGRQRITAASEVYQLNLRYNELTAGFWLGSPSADALAFYNNNGTERARISSTGGFSVGTTADPGAGAIYATGNITAYYSSDIKFKENVRDIPDALATVNAIGGKLFDWTDEYIESKGGADGYFVQKADFGVVAQDVQKVFPIAVRTREDGSLAVDYEKLGALAFAALVELTKRVEALEAK